MNAKSLFSRLKTQSIPANCLNKGDIIDLEYAIAEAVSVTHHKQSAVGECVEIVWKSEDDNGTLVVPAYQLSSDNKWTNFTVASREALKNFGS